MGGRRNSCICFGCSNRLETPGRQRGVSCNPALTAWSQLHWPLTSHWWPRHQEHPDAVLVPKTKAAICTKERFLNIEYVTSAATRDRVTSSSRLTSSCLDARSVLVFRCALVINAITTIIICVIIADFAMNALPSVYYRVVNISVVLLLSVHAVVDCKQWLTDWQWLWRGVDCRAMTRMEQSSLSMEQLNLIFLGLS